MRDNPSLPPDGEGSFLNRFYNQTGNNLYFDNSDSMI